MADSAHSTPTPAGAPFNEKSEAYASARPLTQREIIEHQVEGLIAILGGDINDQPHDDVHRDMEPSAPGLSHPNGAHLFGGGSGV